MSGHRPSHHPPRVDIENGGQTEKAFVGGQIRYVFGTRKKLAPVLAHELDLLVLDEPMNDLDLASAKVVESLLRRHAAGAGPIALSTHSHEFAAAFASGIGLMREGRIASRGVRREEHAYGARGDVRGGDC